MLEDCLLFHKGKPVDGPLKAGNEGAPFYCAVCEMYTEISFSVGVDKRGPPFK